MDQEHRIGELSDDMKDDRVFLLAVPNTLGTIDGGDGSKLNPRQPFMLYIGAWVQAEGRWETTETSWEETHYLDADEPSHAAEISNPGE